MLALTLLFASKIPGHSTVNTSVIVVNWFLLWNSVWTNHSPLEFSILNIKSSYLTLYWNTTIRLTFSCPLLQISRWILETHQHLDLPCSLFPLRFLIFQYRSLHCVRCPHCVPFPCCGRPKTSNSIRNFLRHFSVNEQISVGEFLQWGLQVLIPRTVSIWRHGTVNPAA